MVLRKLLHRPLQSTLSAGFSQEAMPVNCSDALILASAVALLAIKPAVVTPAAAGDG